MEPNDLQTIERWWNNNDDSGGDFADAANDEEKEEEKGREGGGEWRERGAEVKQNERKKGGEGKTGNDQETWVTNGCLWVINGVGWEDEKKESTR